MWGIIASSVSIYYFYIFLFHVKCWHLSHKAFQQPPSLSPRMSGMWEPGRCLEQHHNDTICDSTRRSATTSQLKRVLWWRPHRLVHLERKGRLSRSGLIWSSLKAVEFRRLAIYISSNSLVVWCSSSQQWRRLCETTLSTWGVNLTVGILVVLSFWLWRFKSSWMFSITVSLGHSFKISDWVQHQNAQSY